MSDLIISSIISSGMIMQRDAPFPVWCKEKATVSFLGKKYETASIDGKWLATLDPLSAGGPFTMTITSDEGSVIIQNIFAGDVWLCSGQSNMEMLMQRVRDDFSEEWEAQEFPFVRQFSVPQEWDFSTPRDYLNGGYWISPTKENLHEFCAVPWFFAKNMYQKYKVPIGLITTAWGGTPVETWMSEEALSGFPAKLIAGKEFADEEKRMQITESTNGVIEEWETNCRHEDLGIPQEWKNPKTDISFWDEITLPGAFSAPELEDFCLRIRLTP